MEQLFGGLIFLVAIAFIIAIYSIGAEIAGAIMLYSLNKKQKECEDWEAAIPIVNMIGYSKFAGIPKEYAYVYLGVVIFYIICTSAKWGIASLCSLAMFGYNVYLAIKFKEKYEISLAKTILAVLFGRYILLIGFKPVAKIETTDTVE